MDTSQSNRGTRGHHLPYPLQRKRHRGVPCAIFMDEHIQEIPLIEEMVPLIISDDDPWQPIVPIDEIPLAVNAEPINVSVNGYMATCCMGDFGTHSRRLQILFNPHHPKWGEGFRTKYYRFVEPGKLELRTGELVDIYKID